MRFVIFDHVWETRTGDLFGVSNMNASESTLPDLLRQASDAALQCVIGADVTRLLDAWDEALLKPSVLRRALSTEYVAQVCLLRPDAQRALREDLYSSGRAKDHELREIFEKLERAAQQSRLPQMDQATSINQIKAGYQLHSYQRSILRSAVGHLANGTKRCLIHMPTGAGKTRTAMAVCGRLLTSGSATSALWIAHSEELCEQAALEFDRAWHHLGDREIRTIRNYGRHDAGWDVDNSICITSIQKLVALNRREQTALANMASRLDLLVVDEAHQAIAPEYAHALRIMCSFPKPMLLGLSATPGRNVASEQSGLHELFDGKLVGIDSPGHASALDFLISRGFLARPNFRALEFKNSNLNAGELARLSASADVPDEILQRLAEDARRNVAVLDEIKSLAGRHKRIIVFAPSVEAARAISIALNCAGFKSYAIDAKTPPDLRQRYLEDYKSTDPMPRVLVNFSVLAAGFDAPKTSAVVIARPTKSLILYSQMAGRALRGPAAGGSDSAQIVAIQDTGLASSIDMTALYNYWRNAWTWNTT